MFSDHRRNMRSTFGVVVFGSDHRRILRSTFGVVVFSDHRRNTVDVRSCCGFSDHRRNMVGVRSRCVCLFSDHRRNTRTTFGVVVWAPCRIFWAWLGQVLDQNPVTSEGRPATWAHSEIRSHFAHPCSASNSTPWSGAPCRVSRSVRSLG